jgi:hypothetical protein
VLYGARKNGGGAAKIFEEIYLKDWREIIFLSLENYFLARTGY